MNSLALVAISVPLAVFVGFALGTLAFYSERAERMIRPTMDLLQTVPAFAYLLPILLLFGFGPVVGLIASVLYAFPPTVRNTMLGLRRVPQEVIEAGLMSGATGSQLFWRVRVPSAMRQILLNLASNSIKFTDPGGQIDIHVGRTSAGMGFVRIDDTGVGIPVSEQERILRPFEQIAESDTRSRPGWGLGLSIVSVLVRLHDARMSIVSAPGQGTSITITFQEVRD